MILPQNQDDSTPIQSQPAYESTSATPSSIPGLRPEHVDMLVNGSGIDPDVVRERGYKTCSGYSELKSLGIAVLRDTHTQGLLVPLHGVDGKPATHFLAKENRSVLLLAYRPDKPEIDKD